MAENKIIAGRYEQLELIGAGGMGSVYKGRDTLTGDFVAIKELKPELLKQDAEIIQRFEREGEALRKLNHPNIVKVLANVQDGDEHYIVLEYVKGGSLRDKLDESPQLPIKEVLEIALDLADALTRAHRLNIIHRDIKPANVLMADDGTPRLTDFGVARIGDSSQMTKTGVVMGTLSYLPPEALAGDRIDHRADIWAFGVMLYEMVAGHRPFEGDNSGAIMAGILQKEPPDLLKSRPYDPILNFLAGAIYWMLEKERAKRPDSFRIVGAVLENLISGKEMVQFGNLGGTKTDAERTIAPSEAAALIRDYGEKVYKTGDLEFAPTTPKGISVPPKTETSRTEWTSSKRQLNHPPRLFLSYRREDSLAITGRLYDRLSSAFGEENVFKDMEDIPVGVDFKKVINASIQNSDVVLVIIGRKWLNAADEKGRRLEDPNDFVRLEVESALINDKTLVIPVLVDNADMPEERLLPPVMKELMYRNAAPVRNDPDFNRDVEWLINQIRNSFEVAKPKNAFPMKPLGVIAALVAVIAFVAGIVFFALQPKASPIETITIEPVPAGEYMVLVAEPEYIDGTERDVQSFIVRDLEENLAAVSFSRFHIRAYPAIIRSKEAAETVAEELDAHVVLWGNYDSQRVEMNVQLGDLSLFPNVQFSREEITLLTDASYRMSSEREATLAFGVIAVFNVTHPMANESVEMVRNILIAELINEPSAVVQGNAVNAYYHRFLALYVSDIEAALAEMTTAIEEIEQNAFLYISRSLAYQKLNRIDDSERDIRIARQLVTNPNWIMPEISLVNIAVFIEGDYAKGLALFPNNFEEAAAGNWLYPAYRANLRYYLGDLEGAKSDIELSISLNPTLSIPYTIQTILAFRDGDILKAVSIFDDMIVRFPDARLTERIMAATYSDSVAEGVAIRYFSAFASMLPGDWEGIIEDTQAIIDRGLPNADVYLLRGLAFCNLEEYAEAEAAYTAGLELDENYVMLHALRAEARIHQLDFLGSGSDIAFVTNSGQTQFLGLIEPVSSGELNCKNFFTYDVSSLIEATAEAQP